MRFGEFKSITINNKTVKTIEVNGDIVYPRGKTVTIQFNWNDAHNWDSLRPVYQDVRVHCIIDDSHERFDEYTLSDSNNWTISFVTSLDYELEVITPVISGYTVNVIESNNTFTINCTHAVEMESTSIALSTTDTSLQNYPVDIYVDNVLYESDIEVSRNGYSFEFPKYSQGSFQTLAQVYPSPHTSVEYDTTISGDINNGFVLTVTPRPPNMDLEITIVNYESNYPNDYVDIIVALVNDDTSAIVQRWYYNNFTESSISGGVSLGLSKRLAVGNYKVVVLNANSLIRDCYLDNYSQVEDSFTITENMENPSIPWIPLIYHLIVEEEE